MIAAPVSSNGDQRHSFPSRGNRTPGQGWAVRPSPAPSVLFFRTSWRSFSEQANLTGVSIRGPDHRRKKPDGRGQCLSERTHDAAATQEKQEGREGSSGTPGRARAAGIGKDRGSEPGLHPTRRKTLPCLSVWGFLALGALGWYLRPSAISWDIEPQTQEGPPSSKERNPTWACLRGASARKPAVSPTRAVLPCASTAVI